MTIQQDERGTYILNSKDMKMINHIKEMADAGVTSFKIEGRMKTEYYVGNVTNAYRRAIDLVMSGKPFDDALDQELEKSSHRMYTTGFYFDETDREYIESSTPVSTYDFIANVVEESNNGEVKVEQRNRFSVGDELEILSPSENFNKVFTVNSIESEEGETISCAQRVQEIVTINCPFQLKVGDMLRRKK